MFRFLLFNGRIPLLLDVIEGHDHIIFEQAREEAVNFIRLCE